MLPSQDDDLVADARDIRTLSRPRPFRRARLAGRLAVCAGLIAGISLVARDRTRAPEPAPAWTDPPRSEAAARRVATAEPLFTLREASGEAPARPEPTRWNSGLGQREDSVAQGGFDAIEAPYLIVTATDAGGRPEPGPSLFVTLVRRAADGRGLAVTRTGARGVVATRFGGVETLEATLSGAGSRACIGFRSLDLHAVRLDGWLCGILGQAPEPREVACAIDRVALSGRVAASLGAEEPAGPGSCRPPEMAKSGPSDRTGSIALAAEDPAARHIAAKSRRK